jgi:hypothetical protein
VVGLYQKETCSDKSSCLDVSMPALFRTARRVRRKGDVAMADRRFGQSAVVLGS